MLRLKQGYGTGIDFKFPSKAEVGETMQGMQKDYYVTVYGDGSLTTPTTWWAALGGAGAWVQGWNNQGEEEEHKKERNLWMPGLGQASSSTRQELAAWLMILAEPFRSDYATDSASM